MMRLHPVPVVAVKTDKSFHTNRKCGTLLVNQDEDQDQTQHQQAYYCRFQIKRNIGI